MAYEYRGIEYLRQKLNRKRIRVLRRYNFYEMKVLVRDLGISTPPGVPIASSSPCGPTQMIGEKCVLGRFPGS